MKNKQKLLIDLLKTELGKSQIINKKINSEYIEPILAFAVKHSVAALALDSMLNNSLVEDENIADECKNLLLEIVFQYQKQSVELAKICNLFENSKIDYIILKGEVLRSIYPEPYLRTSCDIDILVKPDDLERALYTLKNNGYCYGAKHSHDVSFYSENDVHIELHYDTIEKHNSFANVHNILTHIWDYALPENGGTHQYALTNEMFYFYYVAHMLKHFTIGGCGIRAFVDLWYLNNKLTYNEDIKQKLLSDGGILKFEQIAKKLTNIWFDDDEHNDITLKLEDFVFKGGVYGNIENHYAIRLAKNSTNKVLLSRIFLKYDTIKFQYPILQKHKWLTPLFEVIRWFRLVFKKTSRERTVHQLYVNKNLSTDTKNDAKLLLDYFEI